MTVPAATWNRNPKLLSFIDESAVDLLRVYHQFNMVLKTAEYNCLYKQLIVEA